jgi:hypothetical protein
MRLKDKAGHDSGFGLTAPQWQQITEVRRGVR